jgi:hypothetical protein
MVSGPLGPTKYVANGPRVRTFSVSYCELFASYFVLNSDDRAHVTALFIIISVFGSTALSWALTAF